MPSVYVLGARQRNVLLKPEEEWHFYESALILQIDTDTGETRPCVEYQSPPEARSEFKRIGYISLPCFNDLHHVTPTEDGNLLVVSTGLDLVVKCTLRSISPQARRWLSSISTCITSTASRRICGPTTFLRPPPSMLGCRPLARPRCA
jgi:hypothetical protein